MSGTPGRRGRDEEVRAEGPRGGPRVRRSEGHGGDRDRGGAPEPGCRGRRADPGRRRFPAAPRADPRPRGGIRVRQDHSGARVHEPPALWAGAARRHRGAAGGSVPVPPQGRGPADALREADAAAARWHYRLRATGPGAVPERVAARGGADRGGVARPRVRPQRPRTRRPRGRGPQRGRSAQRQRVPAPLPAPALRRAAAAHRHRHGVRVPPRGHHPGRAHHRSGRGHPGRRAQDHLPADHQARRRRALHHPRPRRGCAGRQRRRRHAARADCGGRSRGTDAAPPAARVHAFAAQRRSRHAGCPGHGRRTRCQPPRLRAGTVGRRPFRGHPLHRRQHHGHALRRHVGPWLGTF